MSPWQAVRSCARWLEGGAILIGEPGLGPRAPCALVLLLLAFPLSGVPRHLGAPSMTIGLGLAAVVLAATVALLWPLLGLRSSDPARWIPVVSLACAAVCVAVLVMAAPAFDGLPALSGGDAGEHIARQRQFLATGHNDYEGMVTFYATVHWLQVAGADWVVAYHDAFWIVLAVVAVLPIGAAAWASGSLEGALVRGIVLGAGTLAAAGTAWLTTLPLLHYYQCDGFLPQVFGLLPLGLTALAYAGAPTRLVRICALAGGIVFSRFTYLLNLSDLCAVAAALLVVEAATPGLGAWPRRLVGAGAIACAFVAVLGYQALVTVIHVPGGIHEMPLGSIVVGLGLSAAALLAGVPVLRWARTPLPPAAERFSLFVGGLCVPGAAVVAIWMWLGPPAYYEQKYGFAALVLSLVAVPAALCGSAQALVRRPTGRTAAAALGLVALAGAGLYSMSRATSEHWVSFRERVAGQPPWRTLEPSADRTALRFISRELDAHQARFAGFLTASWPESQFVNAAFGIERGPLWDVYQGVIDDEPGSCVFFYAPEFLPARPTGRWAPQTLTLARGLEATPGARCTRYRPRHETADISLCELCFGGHVRELSLSGAISGFHDFETVDEGTARWTDGDGRLGFTSLPGERSGCRVRLALETDMPFSLLLDGHPLDPGPSPPLPELAIGAHLLEIVSPVHIPAEEGHSDDTRHLGVFVKGVSIECSRAPGSP